MEFDATTGQDLVDRLPSRSAVPPELARTFWSAVLLANVALLGVSLGLLFAFFRGWSIPAGLLVLVGLVAGIRTVRRVRAFEGP